MISLIIHKEPTYAAMVHAKHQLNSRLKRNKPMVEPQKGDGYFCFRIEVDAEKGVALKEWMEYCGYQLVMLTGENELYTWQENGKYHTEFNWPDEKSPIPMTRGVQIGEGSGSEMRMEYYNEQDRLNDEYCREFRIKSD